MSGFELMLPPFVASMILVAMLSYLGLHVIAREVIFVDLSLAQMAALGSLSALLFHVAPDSPMTYVFALLATAVGALLFALTRTSAHSGATRSRVPQEAFIGIVYVVASAAAVLVANKVPGGGEAVEKTLVGSLLWVNWSKIVRLAIAYAALGVFHYVLRRRFLTISFHPDDAERQGWKIRLWDFFFYLSFGVVITLAVPIAGVLMVFTFLVVPAVIANLFTADKQRLTIIAWGSGALASVLGLWLSYTKDLPTGPLVVCMYGLLLIGAVVLRKLGVGIVALLVLLSVTPSARLPAQVSVRLSVGARYSTTLVHDSIEVPIDIKPTLAPALQLSVRNALSDPWTGEAMLDISPAKLRREESGASTDVGSFTAIALTVGVRRETHAGLAARVGVGGLVYLTDDASVFQRGNGGVFPLVVLGTTYAPPFGSRHRLEVGLNYDLHRFITPALRSVGYARLRPVHRIAVTVSGRLVGR